MAKQRVHVVAKRRTRPAQAHLQPAHVRNAPLDPARGVLDHPRRLMNMAEAADYLRFNGDRAPEKALHYLQRNHVTLLRRGRAYLVRQASIDHLLETGRGDLDAVAARLATVSTPGATPTVARG